VYRKASLPKYVYIYSTQYIQHTVHKDLVILIDCLPVQLNRCCFQR